MPLKPNITTLRIFKLLLQSSVAQHTAYSVGKSLGLSVQSGYDHMHKLQEAGVLESQLENADAAMVGRPLRRYYRFTPTGRRYATENLSLIQVSSL